VRQFLNGIWIVFLPGLELCDLVFKMGIIKWEWIDHQFPMRKSSQVSKNSAMDYGVATSTAFKTVWQNALADALESCDSDNPRVAKLLNTGRLPFDILAGRQEKGDFFALVRGYVKRLLDTKHMSESTNKRLLYAKSDIPASMNKRPRNI